jgi:hypothetical protein
MTSISVPQLRQGKRACTSYVANGKQVSSIGVEEVADTRRPTSRSDE